MNIAAVDPGVSGSIVVLDKTGSYVAHMIMPTLKIGTKNRVNGAALAAFLSQFELTHCYLEKVQAMPGQGVSSMFSFGHSAGLIEGVFVGAGIPLTLVTPQKWKKYAGLIGTEKDAARSRAAHLYPMIRDLDLKGKGQAIADALMIGRCGLGV